MGADGGLGIWEAEAGCLGPWRRQGDPGACPFQKAPGQGLEAHLYRRARAENVSATRWRQCVALTECLPPQVALKMCQPLAQGPLSEWEAQPQGMNRKQVGPRLSPKLGTSGVPVGQKFIHSLAHSLNAHPRAPSSSMCVLLRAAFLWDFCPVYTNEETQALRNKSPKDFHTHKTKVSLPALSFSRPHHLSRGPLSLEKPWSLP